MKTDTVGWLMTLGSGQTCSRDVRVSNVTIENAKLISPPQFGQVTMNGTEFSYSSNSDFHGEDSFAVLVSGAVHGIAGDSTIRVVVSVGGGSSAKSEISSRVRLPAPLAASRTQFVKLSETTSGVTWQALKIGAGGFITGIDIASDGTKVVRADTYGAWYYNPSTNLWQQIVTMNSMPDGYKGIDQGAGVYEIAIAPSNTQRFYMIFNGHIFRSDNRGGTWIATNFARVTTRTSDGTRTFGRYLAVDPANPDVVYAGTPNSGLFVTTNGGDTWSQITTLGTGSIPVGASQGGGNLIAFDPTSSVRDGVTQGIYVSTYGVGVYHSTNGGSSWTLTTGTPTTHMHMIVDQNGDVWLTEYSYPNNTRVYKYSKGVWSAVSLGYGTQGALVAVDPTNAKRVFVGTPAGQLAISIDGGSTFARPSGTIRVAADIPWLAWTKETYMSAGDMRFDPSATNKLYFTEGIGVWYSNPSITNSTVRWISQSAAIEQLVANWVVSPPGGAPVFSFWDRPVFYGGNLATYPSAHGVNNAHALITGWSIDWASSNPSTIVCLCNFQSNDTSGYSSDGGRTWTTFDRVPANSSGAIYGGCIAASSSTNFLWVQSNHGNPYFTTNGGKTWNQINIPGIPTGGTTGWGFAYYLDRQNCAADRVKANTFYMYNDGSGAAGTEGIYASTDGGATWSHTSSPRFGAAYNVQMRSVPGRAGHLFFTAGAQSQPHPANQPFFRSTDGGKTWQAVADIKEVYAFGFGKASPTGSYPTIFIFGWVKNVMGIWRSDDNASTWTQMSDGYPLGIFDTIKTIEGDSNDYGTVYVGFSGSGFAYGKLNFLLRRDMRGGNDNSPAWINEAG
ncbi:hypothetical protein [Bradyrhizobium sp. McL0616]|uniref:hypothetical protein n=1 Tax=Bradyrhizobium sp. McL0616 TaxID=3415674 RepID=UPI003CF242AF